MGNVAPLLPKIGRVVLLLGSDNDGEVVAAAHAIKRTLAANGCDLHDLVKHIEASERVVERIVYRERPSAAHKPNPNGPCTDWSGITRWCRDNDKGRLSTWEHDFIASVTSQFAYGGTPSPRQEQIIRRIFSKLVSAD